MEIKQQEMLQTSIVHTLLILGGIVMIFPFLWMLLTSLKSFGEVVQVPPTLWPEAIQVQSYAKALKFLPFAALYFNTLAVMVIRVILACVFCSMAGYAFARLRFPGRSLIFWIIISQMMVPPEIFILPQYLMVAKLGMLDTIFALVFPGIVSIFGTFFMRQFFQGIPRSYDEAAFIDGAHQGLIFTRIMVPLVQPAFISLSIFTALFSWRELLWPLIANNTFEKMTLPVGVSSLQGLYLTDYPVLMAAATISIWPMILIFLFFQKQFITGIALSGIKG